MYFQKYCKNNVKTKRHLDQKTFNDFPLPTEWGPNFSAWHPRPSPTCRHLLQKGLLMLLFHRNPFSSAQLCSQLHFPHHHPPDESGSYCYFHTRALPSTGYTALPAACVILFFPEYSSRSSLSLQEAFLIPPVPKGLCSLSVAGILVCVSPLGLTSHCLVPSPR